MLSEQIAQSIVDEVTRRLGYHINVMDRRGIIIGSSDSNRLHTTHQGAIRVLASEQLEALNARQAAHWPGTRPGVNAPIRHHGKVVGVVGITGQPRVVTPLAEAVVMLTELLLEQHTNFTSELSRNELRQQLVQQIVTQEWHGQVDTTEEEWLVGVRRLYPVFNFPVRCLAVRFGVDAQRPDPLAHDRLRRTDLLHAVVGEWWWVFNSAAALGDPLACLDAEERAQAETIVIYPTVSSVYELRRLIPLGLSASRMVKGGIIDLEKQPHLALISGISASDRAAYGAYVGRLNETLRSTLGVWLSGDLNAQRVARALGIHRNTLLYRLSRIRELTGSDPLTASGTAQLQLSWWCHNSVEPTSLGADKNDK